MEKNQENNNIKIKSGLNLSSDIKVAIEELSNMSNEQVDTLIRNSNPNLNSNFNPFANLSNEELEKSFELTESDFDDEKYIGKAYDFARKLDANFAMGLSNDIKDIENITKEQSEILMSNTNAHFFIDINNDEEIKIETSSIIESILIADRLITNSEKTCEPIEMEELPAYIRQGKLISVKPFESENVQPEVIKMIDRGQSYERNVEELLHKVPEIKMIEPDYTESKKVHIPLTGEIAEPDVKIANEIMENLSFSDTLNLISPNHVFGNVQINEQRLNERIFNNNRMLSNLRKSNESSDFKPIEKPFYEEKFIPTEQEFKKEAQAIKSNYPNLGTAQNELAKIYGLKDYRAIKSCFPKSNDEIRTFVFNTYKLNDQELEEFNRLTWKFRVILRELNIGVGLLNQYNAFDEDNIRLYFKDSKHLLIQENSLMMFYRYFLTENSILFGQIKRNIKRLSQDEKLYILKDLESLKIDKNDETVFGLFVNLLAYHIGKSAGDVTLHKNEDGTIEQRFVPKSSSPGIENALINILSNKELKIDSDDNIKVNISSNEILDSMGISQSKEKGFNRAKETLKKFGLKPNEDGDYE